MSDHEEKSESEKKKEDWMNSKWRPAMGWLYMGVCAFDFVIAPVLWSILQTLSKGQINMQWQPLTLQGAGLFHLAMGAVLGIAAYGRTQEKLNGANNGGIQFPSNAGTTYVPPGQTPQNNFGSPMNNSFGNNGFSSQPQNGFGNGGFSRPNNTGFGAAQSPGVITGFGGKPGPAPTQDPIL